MDIHTNAYVKLLLSPRQSRGITHFIYYVHSELMPLYLLTLFAKNERANISKAERNELAELVELLVQIWLET